MAEEENVWSFDSESLRMYVLGAVRIYAKIDSTMDDPGGWLDEVIDDALLDAYREGFVKGCQKRKSGCKK